MSEDKQKLDIHRSELYGRVWSKPLPEAAASYGITIELLRRISGLLEVPLPKPGHWRRLKTPRKRVLPKIAKSSPEKVVLVQKGERWAIAPSSVPGGKALRGKVRAPSEPHPLVERAVKFYAYPTLGALGRLKPSSNSVPYLRVTEGLKERALLVADRLFKELERLGCELKWRGNVEVSTPYGKLRFSIQEEVVSVEREPTPEESKRLWGYERKFYSDETTGALLIQIETYLYGVTQERRWRDEKRSPLEKRIKDVVAGIVDYSRALQEETEAQALRVRQHQEEWQRRCREEEQRRKELRKQERLTEDLAIWKKANEIRAYANQLERAFVERHGPLQPDSELAAWVQWMRDHANGIDPVQRAVGP